MEIVARELLGRRAALLERATQALAAAVEQVLLPLLQAATAAPVS